MWKIYGRWSFTYRGCGASRAPPPTEVGVYTVRVVCTNIVGATRGRPRAFTERPYRGIANTVRIFLMHCGCGRRNASPTEVGAYIVRFVRSKTHFIKVLGSGSECLPKASKGAESFRCRRRDLGMIGVQKYVECREHRLKNTHKN